VIELVLAGLAFIAFGVAAQLLPHSKRWVSNVLSSQSRLPAVLRGGRNTQTEADVKRGVWAFTVFAVIVGLALIVLAISDAVA
jgi:hypothetical protein